MITRVQISLQHFKFISSGHVCSSVIAESWAVVFLILEGNFILLSVMALINTPNLLYNNNSFFHIITDILSFVQPTLQQEFLSSHYHRHAVFCHLDCVHPNSWKVTHRSFNTRCVIRDMYIFSYTLLPFVCIFQQMSFQELEIWLDILVCLLHNHETHRTRSASCKCLKLQLSEIQCLLLTSIRIKTHTHILTCKHTITYPHMQINKPFLRFWLNVYCFCIS